MIVILKNEADSQKVEILRQWLENQNVEIHKSVGEYTTVWGLVGDTSRIDADLIEGLEIVEGVRRISEPYKQANRKFHPNDTVIDLGGSVKLGAGNFQFFAGPCSVESEEQIIEIAKSVKEAGANVLRGGAFKPRTSPYAFQGMRSDGLKLLIEAKEITGMPIVSEIMDASHIDLFEDVDIIQVGARNMQNFELLKQLGKLDKPIFLKRGLCATIDELLMSAEYIMAGGNEKVILCERGIRTFEPAARNTLDLSAVPILKEKTHLPVVVDPSHASGIARLVKPLSYAAAACGADGLMIEVHNNPQQALCDGPQALTPDKFAEVAKGVQKILNALK